MALSSIPSELLWEILQPRSLGSWPVDRCKRQDLRNWRLVCKRWKAILDTVVVDPDAAGDLADTAPQEIVLKELSRLDKKDLDNVDVGNVLCAASYRGHDQVLRWALEHGGDPDNFEDGFQDLLMDAVRSGYARVVQLLLDYEDVNVRDRSGWTPLYYAICEERWDVVKVLVESGADVTADNSYMMAVEHQREDIIQLLFERGSEILASRSHEMEEALGKSVRTKHKPLMHLLLLDPYDSGTLQDAVLASAAMEQEESVVRLLLENGFSLPSDPGAWVLRSAARTGNESILRLLLENGEDTSECGLDALCDAARKGHLAAVKLLLEHGANTGEVPDLLDRSLIAAAVQGGNEDILRLLLGQGKLDPNPVYIHNNTLLGHAIEHRRLPSITLLLDSGLDVNATTEFSYYTALHVAARTGQLTVVDQLLDRGASVHPERDGDITPLQLAVENGHVPVVERLLDHGANVNAARRDSDKTLHTAARNMHLPIAKRLLESGADVKACSSNKTTPLHLAAMHGPPELVELLLSYGAEVNALTLDLDTPLHRAANSAPLGVVQHLLNHGADVRAANHTQTTALHLAASKREPVMVEQLLSHGADVAAADLNKNTPLHLSAANSDPHVAQLLLKHGADVNAVEYEHIATLHLAVMHSYLPLAKLLIEAGANVSAQTLKGETPLHYAVYHQNEEIVRLLLENGADVDCPNQHGRSPRYFAEAQGRKVQHFLPKSFVAFLTSVFDEQHNAQPQEVVES